jgi:hypothetical protein
VTINITRRNMDPIEVGIGLLIVGVIGVTVLATVSGGGGGRTADPGDLRACLGREVGVVSHLHGFSGEPSDAQTSFALIGNAVIVDVFVMQDPGAAEGAASDVLQRRPRTLVPGKAASPADVSARASSSENVMWVTLGSEKYDSRIRTCIGEAS